MQLKFVGSVLLTLLMFSSCQREKSKDYRTQILVTTGMIGDVVKNITGDNYSVHTLMNPGVDPHLYKASLNDLKKIIGADLIFYNGLHLEGKLAKVLEKQKNKKPIIGLGDYLTEPILLEEGVFDPHIWFDVQNWIDISAIALDTLSRLFPADRSIFKENHDRYTTELKDLHQWVKEQINKLPEHKRIMITAHDAFNYFGRAYDIHVRGLQGISTLTEFGLRDVTNFVDYIVTNDVHSIFVESSVSTKSLDAVVNGARSRGVDLKIGGNLYSDSMGKEGSAEGTYIGMIKHNVNTIVKGLK